MTLRKSTLVSICLFGISGMLMLVSLDVQSITVASYLVGIFATAYMILSELRTVSTITAFGVLAINIATGYVAGPAFAVGYQLIHGSEWLISFSLTSIGAQDGYIIGSAFGVLSTITLLIANDLFRSPLLKVRQGDKKISHGFLGIMLLLFYVLIIITFMRGNIGYMGIQSEQGSSKISPLGAIAELGLLVIPSLLVIYFASSLRRWRNIVIGALLMLATIIAIAIIGRRYLIFSVLTAVFFAAYFFPDWFRTLEFFHFRNGWRLRKKTIELALLGILCSWLILSGMHFFYNIRMATYAIGPDHSALELTEYALSHESASNQQGSSYDASSFRRVDTLPAYLGDLIHAHGEAMHGECLFSAVVEATPRLLFPDKSNFINDRPCDKYKINAERGLLLVDSPVTLLTYGYVDFGFFGIILYPMLIALFYAVMSAFTGKLGSRTVSMWVAASSFVTLFYVEQSLSYYFSQARNILIVTMLIFLIEHLYSSLRMRVSSNNGNA